MIDRIYIIERRYVYMNYSYLYSKFLKTPPKVLSEMKYNYCEESGFDFNDVNELDAFIYYNIVKPQAMRA